jgi:hypothetical protein
LQQSLVARLPTHTPQQRKETTHSGSLGSRDEDIENIYHLEELSLTKFNQKTKHNHDKLPEQLTHARLPLEMKISKISIISRSSA